MTARIEPTEIHSRALLVWLSISTWSARKYDKQISQKVNDDYHASSDAGRYNKFLLPGDAKSYKALVALASAIRVEHYSHSLAWSDEGWRLLPSANYLTYTEWLRKRRNEFEAALTAFESDYPSLRDFARASLNGLFKIEDYPATSDIRKRFQLGVQYSPVPAAGDIRVDLASDQVELIEASIRERIEAATGTAVRDAWDRLHGVVSKLAVRLADPEAIFRDSLIENAREICGSLSRLNITDDPDLERMRATVANELIAFEPQSLRDQPTLRQTTADKAAEILRSMQAFYSPDVAS